MEEEPWLYEPGGMGDMELCTFDRVSVAVTRSHPAFVSSGNLPDDLYQTVLGSPQLVI